MPPGGPVHRYRSPHHIAARFSCESAIDRNRAQRGSPTPGVGGQSAKSGTGQMRNGRRGMMAGVHLPLCDIRHWHCRPFLCSRDLLWCGDAANAISLDELLARKPAHASHMLAMRPAQAKRHPPWTNAADDALEPIQFVLTI